MKRDWKPGDVAIWDHGDAGRTDVIFRFLGGDDFDIPEWQTDTDGCGYPNEAQLRRAVVIDPEDREQVERLAWSIGYHGDADLFADRLQAALREFANPRPPKPEEPTGLGAVVEESDGAVWVRTDTSTSNRWVRAGFGTRARWDGINAVRVLSEGVTQ